VGLDKEAAIILWLMAKYSKDNKNVEGPKSIGYKRQKWQEAAQAWSLNVCQQHAGEVQQSCGFV